MSIEKFTLQKAEEAARINSDICSIERKLGELGAILRDLEAALAELEVEAVRLHMQTYEDALADEAFDRLKDERAW